MSPIPYVRFQVVILGASIACAGALWGGWVPPCCALVALAWLVYLRHRYRRDVERADGFRPTHRAALDSTVAGDAFVLLALAVAICAAFALFPIHPASWLHVCGKSLQAFAIGWTVVYASSLVDWYVVLPRISGQLCFRPCRSAEEEEEFSFPSTWREVTRWWYIHRVIAAVAFRGGLSAAIAIAAAAVTGVELLGRAVAWTALLAFGAYAFMTVIRGVREAKQVGQAGHPKGFVGQTVKVERRLDQRTLWGAGRGRPALAIDGNHLVVDVALESIQLAEVAGREADTLPAPIRFEKNFDSVPLSDVDAIRQAQPKFGGCREGCSGINWYCIENPRCYQPK